jgi:hypothetical protein
MSLYRSTAYNDSCFFLPVRFESSKGLLNILLSTLEKMWMPGTMLGIHPNWFLFQHLLLSAVSGEYSRMHQCILLSLDSKVHLVILRFSHSSLLLSRSRSDQYLSISRLSEVLEILSLMFGT